MTWTTGDFEVTTSDNVRFFVPSYHLFSSSSVFRDAHHMDNDAGGKHQLTFTDPVCEASHVFALYLQLVSHGELHVDRHLKYWKGLVVFLDKWDCQQPLQLLCARLGMAVQSKHSRVATLEAFIVACMARDDNLCALILTSRRNSKWRSVKEGAGGKKYELSHHRKESLWDPRFWPAYLWSSGVSNTYLYAVARAFGDHGTDETLAEGFLHYLAQIPRRNPHA
ncbi:hypothetical protein CcaverHIS631_0600390 [Cutaneotrichosporon cavernicola]|nr:hypothetical protein CcaverHIS631_0600390 [Cutaneotrichosporon cavernicola]BEJ09124.1 hypothetical protein CcaverHIS641_0600390 [Cutaneotrichosporon cavernicola]